MFDDLLKRLRPQRPQITLAQWQQAETCLPFLDLLDASQRERLRTLAGEFLHTKSFAGAHDIDIPDAVRLEIALQACLPILSLGLAWYDDWEGIVVYPGDFVVPRQITDEAGVVHEYRDTVLGEAWQGGPVLLGWSDADDTGCNVVIHEFAHKLDMRNGVADGLPPLHADMRIADWAAAFGTAWEDLRRRVASGRETLFDAYAAESPAEFFAVMSECFFEIPDLLQARYPALYEQLSRFYGLDLAPRARVLFAQS